MLALLPLACIAFVAMALRLSGSSLREAVLSGSVTAGLYLVAVTEVTSVFHAFGRTSVAIAWLVATCLAVWLSVRARRRSNFADQILPGLDRCGTALLVPIALIAAATLLCGVLSAPNNWDSMTYHLPRVAHWIRAGSVEHYPTAILRQLQMSPWAEFAIAHLELLSDSSRFAATIQWLSFMGSLAGVSLIAKRLGATRHAQLVAAAIAATVPMAILQASSTQNDLVVAFWLIAMTEAALCLVLSGPSRPSSWLQLGGALGLAMLTKGTAYIFALPALLWLGVSLLRAHREVPWRYVSAAIGIALAANAGHWYRNFRTFGAPLGPDRQGNTTFSIDGYSAKNALSGILRNLALHAGASERVASAATSCVSSSLRAFGVDANDPSTTWPGEAFLVPGPSTHEDRAGNVAHLWLYLLGAAAALWFGFIAPTRREGGRRHTAVAAYAVCGMTAFLLFSILLRWQPWHSRLHTPLFMLFAPVVACTFDLCRRRACCEMASIAFALAIVATPWWLSNASRPLYPLGRFTRTPSVTSSARASQYFTNRPELRDSYLRATRCVADYRCTDVGLLATRDGWEYPLWVLLKPQGGALRIEHLDLPSGDPWVRMPGPPPDFRPCAAIALAGRIPDSRWGLWLAGACSDGVLKVYLR